MKGTRLTVAILVIAFILLGFSRNLFSWNLVDFFASDLPEKIEAEMLADFDAERDIPDLPSLEGKSSFEAVRDLSIFRNDEVREYIYLYLTTGRPYVIRSINRSHDHLDLIQEIFQEDPDMPMELTLLPLLESGFHPRAVSRSGAVGLWQFMYATGRPLGLDVNRWVDERRNVEKSTRAAMRHLKNLYNHFGSWELALAAYNGGGGHVSRAMKRSGNKDFWSLARGGHLRQETEEYVPRFLALLTIYEHASLFGIAEEVKKKEQRTMVQVEIDHPLHLKTLSKHTGIPLDVLRKHNPELHGYITPPNRPRYIILIPEKYHEDFEKARPRLFSRPLDRVIPHRVRSGEYLHKIARHYKKKHQNSFALTT